MLHIYSSRAYLSIGRFCFIIFFTAGQPRTQRHFLYIQIYTDSFISSRTTRGTYTQHMSASSSINPSRGNRTGRPGGLLLLCTWYSNNSTLDTTPLGRRANLRIESCSEITLCRYYRPLCEYFSRNARFLREQQNRSIETNINFIGLRLICSLVDIVFKTFTFLVGVLRGSTGVPKARRLTPAPPPHPTLSRRRGVEGKTDDGFEEHSYCSVLLLYYSSIIV